MYQNPNLQYGLNKRESRPPVKQSKPALFDNGDDDEDDRAIDVKKALIQKSLKQPRGDQYDAIAAKALQEDPNIFDFDGHFTAPAPTKPAPVSSEPPQKKARYIDNLKASVQLRSGEQERVFERKLLKERTEEDDQFGDKPKFVTSAYKQKLMEDQKWDMEDRMMEEVEKRHDVRSLGMQGFYSNLLTKNVAMGGDVSSNAISAYTAGSDRQVHVSESTAPSSSSSSSGSGSAANGGPNNSNSSTGSNGNSSSERRAEPSSAAASTAERRVEITATDSEVSSVRPAPSKEVTTATLDSARERYLARKRSLAAANVE